VHVKSSSSYRIVSYKECRPTTIIY